jgi:hypothetical protein
MLLSLPLACRHAAARFIYFRHMPLAFAFAAMHAAFMPRFTLDFRFSTLPFAIIAAADAFAAAFPPPSLFSAAAFSYAIAADFISF